MTYVSGSAIPGITNAVAKGAANAEVMGVRLVTSGTLSPLNIDSLGFSTNGTTSPADIANARVWYTGHLNALDTTAQYGTVAAAPNGTFTVSGTRALVPDTNYLWLTYDVLPGATTGHVIDGECPTVYVSGASHGTDTAGPAGSRTIKPAFHGTYTIGSSKADYATMTAAFQDLRDLGVDGATTFLLAADYNPSLETIPIELYTFPGASESNRVTVKPAPGATINITVGANYIFALRGASYVTIDGNNGSKVPAERHWTFYNNPTSSGPTVLWINCLDASHPASHNIVKNCVIKSNGWIQYGIADCGSHSWPYEPTAPNSYNTYDNILFTGVGYGMYKGGPSAANPDQGFVFSNNVVGRWPDDQCFAAGAWMWNCRDAQIYGNDIQAVGCPGSIDQYGFRSYDCPGLQFYRNKIHGIRNTGTASADYRTIGAAFFNPNFHDIGTPSNNLIYNNVIFDVSTTVNNNTSVGLIGIAADGYQNRVDYNSVHIVDRQMCGDILPGDAAAMFNGDPGSTSYDPALILRNNLIYLRPAGGLFTTAYSHYTKGDDYSEVQSDNNFSHPQDATSGHLRNYGRTYSGPMGNLAQWMAATMQDVHSNIGEPNVSSPTNPIPQTGSPLLAAGTPITGIIEDYFNQLRDLLYPTIGAFETWLVLPVELAGMSAQAQDDNTVLVSWATASERNTLRWDIERAAGESGRFAVVGTVAARGASTQLATYSYRDPVNAAGAGYSYRLALVNADGSKQYFGPVRVGIAKPAAYGLSQAFPNPFGQQTAIRYQLSAPGRVSLKVYNLQGQLVKTLVDQVQTADYYRVAWNGRNDGGKRISAGVYLYRLEVNGFSATRKATVIK